MHILLLLLLCFLAGCGAPNNDWKPTNTVHGVSRTVLVNANNKDWTDSGIHYNKNYNYKIQVVSASPTFTQDASMFKAMARGTATFCNNYGTTPITPTTSYSLLPRTLAITPKNSCGSLTPTTLLTAPNVSTFAIPIGQTIQSCPTSHYALYGCTSINGALIPGTTTTGKVAYMIEGDSKYDFLLPGGGVTNIVKALPLSGNFLFAITDDDRDFTNNYGQYEIQIEHEETGNSTFITGLAKFFISPLVKSISAISNKLWDNTINNQEFQNIISAMVTLYIVILGIFFAIGGIKMTQSDFISRIVKIGILYTLLKSNSHEIFNKYLLNLFTLGQNYLINTVTDPTARISALPNALNYNTMFGFTSYVIEHIFSLHFLKLIPSLILWFPIGWLSFFFLLVVLIFYTLAIIEAIIMYLIAFTAISFLISMGPLFISLILFDKTKNFFTAWLGAIISFTMQPVILFASIMILTIFINGAIDNIMAVDLVSNCVIPIFIDFPDPIGKINLFCIFWPVPDAPKLDFLRDVIILYLFIDLLRKIPKLATDLSTNIFGGSTMVKAAAAVASGMASMAGLKKAAKIAATRRPFGGDKKEDDKSRPSISNTDSKAGGSRSAPTVSHSGSGGSASSSRAGKGKSAAAPGP